MTTTTVSSTDALIAALRSAHAGDTILLAAGTYNAAWLSNFNFSSAVTIKSADPTHQAVINNLEVSNSSGLVFSQLQFATVGDMAATVVGSHNITFSNDTFQGAATGTGNAMMIRESDGITVTGSDFSKFWSGINELNASNVTITNNTFHGLANAAIRGTGAKFETITGNTFADANPSLANHSDAIYLWQDNTANHVTIGANTYGSTGGTSTSTGSTGGSTTTTPPTTTTTPPTTTTTPPTTTTTPPATTAPVPSSTITVGNTTELWTALKNAHGGETILLKAGVYDAVPVDNFNFSSTVTIQSADASHPAVLNNLEVVNTSNVVFDHVSIATTTGTAATVASSHNITFSNDAFQGQTVGTGNAMLIRDSDGVTVTGSDVGKLWAGVTELNSSHLTITNNTFHDLQDAGVRGTGATYETISGNTFANANPLLATHTDAINLWQDNTANHVTITNNTFGSGAPTAPVTAPVTTAPVTTAPVTSTPSSSTSTGTGGTTTSAASTGSGSTVTNPSTGAQTVTVGSSAELWNALKNAHGGDTILLKAGTYDNVGIYNFNYSSAVTIQSADPTHQALINNLDIEGSSGITVKNVNVEVTGTSNFAALVGGSSHVSLDHLTVTGTASTLTGVGVFVRSSNDVSVTNSDISQLGSGIGHLDDSGLTISNNTLHYLEADGIFGGGSSHVLVSGNNISSFFTDAGDHPDAIQFWGGDTAATAFGEDVQIINNVITRGDGNTIQGIFIASTNDVTISGNAMAGTMTNGIAVAGTSNVTIENNYLNEYTDQGTAIVVRGASANVTVVHNAAYVQNYAGDGVNPNFVGSDNTPSTPSAIGDLTALRAWISAHTGVTAATMGGEGSDTLTGTAGADTMSGGFGDDAYIVNNAGDVVNEAANAGVDTINSSLSTYTLGANVENLALTGTAAQTGVGNGLNNVMIGNGVQSSLNGGAGNDTLISMGGATTLTGGAGSDVFSIGAKPASPVQITDFTAGQDKLDLHTLLANYHGTDPVADQWVQFQNSSSGVTVLIDVDGPSGAAGFVTVAKVAGVTSLAATDWVFH